MCWNNHAPLPLPIAFCPRNRSLPGTVGAAALTTTTISSVEVSALSLTVSRNVYVPAAVNVAVAFRALTPTKTTDPGPVTLLQLADNVLPLGSPSSLAVPTRLAADGIVIVWSSPAFTKGAWFAALAALTVITTSSVAEACHRLRSAAKCTTRQRRMSPSCSAMMHCRTSPFQAR